MLMLLFYIGDERYALSCSKVVEVIPMVVFRKLHHAPEYVAGLFNYRGTIVPVIDLSQLIQESPCSPCLSTRIIMVNYEKKNQQQRLGLMAERVTDTIDLPEDRFVEPGITFNESAYLGKVVMDEKGTIQRITIEGLLSERAQAYLLPHWEQE